MEPFLLVPQRTIVLKTGRLNAISTSWEGRKMRRKQVLTSLITLVIATVAFVGIARVDAQQSKSLITVMNPAITSKMVDRVPLSPRLDKLEGKTIYMVDISWGGPEAGYSVFEEMQSWFAQNMPSVKTVLKRKTGMYTQDDPKLWAEIKQNGNAAIIGISG
jgi:hypothetical protein